MALTRLPALLRQGEATSRLAKPDLRCLLEGDLRASYSLALKSQGRVRSCDLRKLTP